MTDRFFGSKGWNVHELWDGHYSWRTPLHEPQTTSTINYNVQFGYYATWDYNKFINRGGNGDSDTAGIDGQSYMTLMEIAG